MAGRSDASMRPRGTGRALLAYNVWRLLLLAVCLGVGWLAQLRGLWLIVVALLVSGLLSYLLLAKQRVAMGIAVETQVNRSRERLAERTHAEDAYVDALHAAAGDDQAQPAVDTPSPVDRPPH